eukprot:Skav216664  [mRNA]  locus=scaffold930:73509:78644:- [translate_table: standard]
MPPTRVAVGSSVTSGCLKDNEGPGDPWQFGAEEHQAGNALDALAKLSQPEVSVMRGGEVTSIPTAPRRWRGHGPVASGPGGGPQVVAPRWCSAQVDVVRGDIILLETGDVVPADLRLITAADLMLGGDQRSISGGWAPRWTWEARERGGRAGWTKLTPENMVFSGCPVANGKCKGVVIATGMDTRIGEIAKMMASEDKEAADHE